MIKVSKIHSDAVIPTRKHSNDAGMDLYAYGNHLVKENGIKIIPTAIRIALPKGYVGLIWPKSKSNYLIGGGVIDEGYQGEILVKIINVSGEDIYISHGNPIAQFLIQPCYTPEVVEVDEKNLFIEESDRGFTGGIVEQVGGTYNVQFADGTVLVSGESNHHFLSEKAYESLMNGEPLIEYTGETED